MLYNFVGYIIPQGWHHKLEGNALEGGGRVYRVKTLTFEKGGGCMSLYDPASS